MIRRIFAAYAAELFKYSRLPFPYIGLLLTLLGLLASSTVPSFASSGEGFAFISDSVPAALNVSFLMLLVYGASLVAGEAETGTIRTVLVRPLRRREFLTGKLMNTFTYALLLNLFVVSVAWIVPAARRHLSGVDFGGELIYTAGEMNAALALAVALNVAPHLTGAAFAVMMSTLTQRSSTAIGLTIGIWLLVDYLKHRLMFAPFVFTSYLEQSWVVFADRARGLATPFFPDAAFGLFVCLFWFLIFSAVAFITIRQRNFGP